MAPKKAIFTNSEDKWDYIISLIVIVIFSVFIYQLIFNTAEEAITDTEIESNKTEIGSAFSDSKENENYQLNTTTIQVEDAYESDKKTAVILADFKENEPLATDTISKPIPEADLSEKTLQDKSSDSIATTPLLEEQETSVQIEPKKNLKTETPKNETVKTEKPALATKTKTTTANKNLGCAVIVGVFKTASNKVAVIDKLKSLGYAHTNGILREGLSYVGVPVACENEQEKQKLLTALNKAFGIDSWVKKI